jgi:hypothetical protein
VAVVACLGVSGAVAVTAALQPDAPLVGYHSARAFAEAGDQLRYVGAAVQRFAHAHGGACPASLGGLRRAGYLEIAPIDRWGQPLQYGCVEGPPAFLLLSTGPDRRAGTDDDLLFWSP